MLNVKIIVGSTRQGRFSEKVLPWLNDTLASEKNLQLEVLDLREYPMPFLDSATPPSYITNGDYGHAATNAWSKKVAEADAYIMIVPEYNHGYPAVLKNALDVIYNEWGNKPVAFISYGGVGGSRAVEQLRLVVEELHLHATRNAVYSSSVDASRCFRRS
jgi:NAD(P)H-dependent FMN reductase